MEIFWHSLTSEIRFIGRNQFLSIYWLAAWVAFIVLSSLFWKEKMAFLKITATFLIFFFTYRMLVITLPYTAWEIEIDFLLTKHALLFQNSKNIRYLYLTVFYLHIFSAPFVLISGVTQFSRTLMYEQAKWHRNVGKLYVALVLFISAPSGFVMSFFANGNIVSKFSFGLLTLLWWLLTLQAYRLIRQRKVIEHANFMLRSYALTFSAITLRIYMYLIGSWHLFPHWTSTEIYVMLSFMSWIPNLIVAEMLIYAGFTKKLIQKKTFLSHGNL